MRLYQENYRKKGRLSGFEFPKIKEHPKRSVDILRGSRVAIVGPIIEQVHEREKGQGYPAKKRGDAIDELSKVVALCDVYEAMTHQRAYRDRFSKTDVMKKIIEEAGSSFDVGLVKAFLEFLSIYPVGSYVLLNTGEVAVVLRGNKDTVMKPTVRILMTPVKQVVKNNAVVNLSKNNLIYITGPIDKSDRQKLSSVAIWENCED